VRRLRWHWRLNGAYVAVAARRGGRLEELVKEIEDKGGQAMPIIADVADERQAHDMVNTAYGRWGRLDIVVNNAGVMLLGSNRWGRYRRLAAYGERQFIGLDVYYACRAKGDERATSGTYRQHFLGGRPHGTGGQRCL